MQNPSSKEKWKTIVKYHQDKYWHRICSEDQSSKKSLDYLQIQEKPSFKPHNIWQCIGNNPINVKTGEIKSRIVTQTYMLQTVRSRHNKTISPTCKLCDSADEDLEHFILVCVRHQCTRERHIQKIRSFLNKCKDGLFQDIIRHKMLLQVVIDCTHKTINYGFHMKRQQLRDLENLTRLFCYDLHTSRMKQMAG